MDSDSRMGQGLGQNPGKPEGHFPSENRPSESRERNFSPTPGKSRAGEKPEERNGLPEASTIGLCAAFADGVRKHPLPDLRPHLARFCGAFGEAAIPCAKPAESDRFHDPSQGSDFPGKPRTTQGSETKQEKALTLYAPGRSLPPAVRAVFPGLRIALFSHGP